MNAGVPGLCVLQGASHERHGVWGRHPAGFSQQCSCGARETLLVPSLSSSPSPPPSLSEKFSWDIPSSTCALVAQVGGCAAAQSRRLLITLSARGSNCNPERVSTLRTASPSTNRASHECSSKNGWSCSSSGGGSGRRSSTVISYSTKSSESSGPAAEGSYVLGSGSETPRPKEPVVRRRRTDLPGRPESLSELIPEKPNICKQGNNQNSGALIHAKSPIMAGGKVACEQGKELRPESCPGITSHFPVPQHWPLYQEFWPL